MVDPVESYIPLYDVRRGPRVTTTVDDHDWVSYAFEAIDLDSIDPAKRFVPSSTSVTSILHAWPNPDLPWGSHIPTSLIEGEDMLAWLLPAVPRSAIAQIGERFIVQASWKEQANAVAPRIAAACACFVQALPSVFERRVLSGTVACHPTSYDEHVLEGIDFDSASDAHAYLSSLGDEVVSNLGFLGWFTDCVTGWEVLVPIEVADFIKQLRLKERRKRGCIVNPVIDWPSVDLPWLYKNGVPFHYMWTEEAARDQRFIQLNPEYLKHYRRLSRDLGRTPQWEEVMKDHEEWGDIYFTDEYLQENLSPSPVNKAAKPLDEREYFIQPHEFWFPHKLESLSVARRVLSRCNGSFPEFCDRAEQLPVWIRGWTGSTIHRGVSLKDRLDFYGLPTALLQCRDVNCRELKKIACAPTPLEMLMENERARLEARFPNIQVAEPKGIDVRSRFNTHSDRAQGKLAGGLREKPVPPSSRARLPLLDRLSSPVPSSHSPPPPPLTTRIGPRVADVSDEMDWEAGDGSAGLAATSPPPGQPTASAGAGPSAMPPVENSRQGRERRSRGYVVAVGEASRRRSASPARRGPPSTSPSSASTAPAPVRRDEGVTVLPDPSARYITISRFDTREWRRGIQRLDLELATIRGKTSPKPSVASIRRQIQDIRWSPVVIQHAYVHATWKQDELRFWSWGADKRVHRDHADLLNHALAVGRPLTIALPESMLPEVAPPEVEESEEHGHRVQGLVLDHEGRRVLAERYKAGLKMLAGKPHAGSFIFLGGAANFVVRRFMWHWVKDRIGEGVCRETTIRHKGRTAQPQDGTGVTVYHDFAEVEEHEFIVGKVLFPRDGDRSEAGVRYYFPPYDVVFDSSRDWHGEWTNWDEDLCLSIAEGIDNGTAEPKPYGEWQKILHRDRVRSVQSHQLYHLFRNKLRASDARAWSRYMAEIHGLNSGSWRRVKTLFDSLEPRFLLKE